MKRNAHKSIGKVTAKRSAAAARIYEKSRDYFKMGQQFERAGNLKKAEETYRRAFYYLKKAGASGVKLPGPVGKLPNPKRKRANPLPANEWDDLDEAEAFTLGSRQARELGHARRKASKLPKYFKGGYFSKMRGRKVTFIQPIQADSIAAAKAQVKAMVTNEKPVNITAVEVRRNPGLIDLAANLQAADFVQKYIGGGGKKRRRNASDSSVRSPTRTSTEVRSPTKTSTQAHTSGNVTVTGGAGAGANTTVKIIKRNPARYRGYTVRHSDGSVSGSYPTKAQARAALARGRKQFGVAAMKGWRVVRDRADNPSVKELSKTFQGKASGAVTEYKAANSAPNDLARLGRLILFELEDGGGQKRVPSAMVAADRNERLWFLSKRGSMFTRKAKPGQLLDWGHLKRVVYETVKDHIESGKLVEYDHTFEHPRPRFYVDAEGMPVIKGGGYRILAEGITG